MDEKYDKIFDLNYLNYLLGLDNLQRLLKNRIEFINLTQEFYGLTLVLEAYNNNFVTISLILSCSWILYGQYKWEENFIKEFTIISLERISQLCSKDIYYD